MSYEMIKLQKQGKEATSGRHIASCPITQLAVEIKYGLHGSIEYNGRIRFLINVTVSSFFSVRNCKMDTEINQHL
jgi:hypothetical protein